MKTKHDDTSKVHSHIGAGSRDRGQTNRMAVNTLLLDFQIDPALIVNPVESKTLLQTVETVLRSYVPKLKKLDAPATLPGLFSLYTDDRGTLISVRAYVEGILTVNVEYYLGETDAPVLRMEQQRGLELDIKGKLGTKRSKLLPPIRRGAKIDQYTSTSDERLLEYDFDEILFDEMSQFQKVEIVHSKSYGNMLILDGLQNLAESDLSYTHGLMNIPEYDYKDKTILILGGGDGALLHELLKEKPAFVTMVEIDEVVMKACRKYMRSVCGDCMDTYKGDNYEILVTDAVKVMRDYLAAGRKFDYVIGDLTDVPLSEDATGEVWDFMRLIINIGVKLIGPGGRYLTHTIGISATEALEMFEDMLKKLETQVTFTHTSTFVPSFLECWVFYQISVAS